ncbi:MAG: DUF3089 domain-containing protein [Lacibacter sp.]
MILSKYILSSLLFLFLVSCNTALKKLKPSYEKEFSSLPKNPDYSDLHYWAAHPSKKDPSDSIPKPLQTEIRDSIADVFFVHPTTLTSDKTKSIIWNASLTDAELNLKTDYSSILYQASVFNKNCRVFAPRYRQAHLYSFFTEDTVQAKRALDFAYEDIKNAFEYYLKYYNKGRPIIIASHSQGTFHCIRLLKEFFENTPLQKQLIGAYLTGFSVPKTYYTTIEPCKTDTATSCFVTWRTYKNGFVDYYIKKENGSSWVVNPLSWTLDTLRISRKQNKGAVFFNFKKIHKHSNSAKISNGVIWTNRPRFPFSFFMLMHKKNYHPGDINLFYMNIRENVQQRINAYMRKSNGQL